MRRQGSLPRFALAAAFAAAGTSAAAASKVSGRFLAIDASPRQAAMGGAAAGLADDVSAVHYNPAGLSQLIRREAGFVHQQYAGGVNYEYAAYAHPTARRGTWAGDLGLVRYGTIKGYTEADAPTGDVAASDMKLTAAWAGAPLSGRHSGLKTGIAAKYVRSQLDVYTASAFAADLGLLYPAVESSHYSVRLGGALRNLGSRLNYASEAADLPRAVVLGVGFKGLQESVSLGLDLELPQAASPNVRFGAEWWTMDLLALRLGWRGAYELGPGISAGIGIKFGAAQFDFAVVPAGALGYITQGGVLFRFGGVAGDLYARGVAAMNQRRYADAIETFTRLLTADPNNRDAVLRLRECQKALEQQMRPP